MPSSLSWRHKTTHLYSVNSAQRCQRQRQKQKTPPTVQSSHTNTHHANQSWSGTKIQLCGVLILNLVSQWFSHIITTEVFIKQKNLVRRDNSKHLYRWFLESMSYPAAHIAITVDKLLSPPAPSHHHYPPSHSPPPTPTPHHHCLPSNLSSKTQNQNYGMCWWCKINWTQPMNVVFKAVEMSDITVTILGFLGNSLGWVYSRLVGFNAVDL